VLLSRLQRRRSLARQAVALHVFDSGLALALGLAPTGHGGDGLKPPVLGEGQEGGVEHDLVRAMVQHCRPHVVDQDGGGHATCRAERHLEASEQHLLRLADRELQETPARVAEHVDEPAQPTPTALVLDEVPGFQPVRLSLLAGPGLEAGGPLHRRLPAESTAGHLHPLVAAVVAPRHHLPEEHPGAQLREVARRSAR
jgi:hypothetical protein